MNFNENRQILDEFHLGMFEYIGLPETLRANYLEFYLITTGRVAIFRVPEDHTSSGFPAGSLIACRCTLSTELDPYGEGSEVICVTRNGWSKTMNRYSDDMVLGFNNLTELPCVDINDDALMLSEVDKSLYYLAFWTRLAPVIRCMDEKERQEVITAFKNIKEGIPVTIVSKKILQDLGLSENFTIEDLTRPDFADKIQHTARLREDILRWHYTRYGQTVQGDTKLAQQTVDEVNGSVSSSLIIPLNMLAQRKVMVEEINRKFGTNISVELSGSWRGQVTKYENDTGEPEIDNNDTDPDPDPAGDPEDEKKEGEE